MDSKRIEEICCKAVGIVKDAALFIKAELGQVQDDQILEKGDSYRY